MAFEPEAEDEVNQNLLENILDPQQNQKNAQKNMNEVQQKRIKSSWFIRTFSPLNEGSLRGSIISISATAIGTGVLALQKTATHCGILLGILMLLGSAYITFWSMMVMMKAFFISGKNQYTEFTEYLL